MADNLLQLNIVTPERSMVTDKVNQVNIPGSEGDLGILYDHAPILTTMRPGQLSYEKDSETVYLVVSGGYLEVTDNRVTVLAETAEFLSEIDRDRAEKSKTEAESLLTNAQTEEEFRDAQLKLFRAIARLESTEKK
jgi:F-type H+-transporting ATPase subunit epsilon